MEKRRILSHKNDDILNFDKELLAAREEHGKELFGQVER